MSFAQLFQKGKRYVAGAQKPFIVSHARIKSWATDHGFTNVVIEARADLPGGKVPFETSSDDWDTLVAADHLGPDEVIDLPGEPAWVVAGDAAAAAPSSPAAPPANPIAPANPQTIQLPPGAGATPAQLVAVYVVLGTILAGGVAAGAYYVLRRRKRNTNPRGSSRPKTRIQSILIDRGAFTEREARAWVQREGFRSTELDATPHLWRFRQEDPRRFSPRTFRTIHLTTGVHAIIARPRE